MLATVQRMVERDRHRLQDRDLDAGDVAGVRVVTLVQRDRDGIAFVDVDVVEHAHGSTPLVNRIVTVPSSLSIARSNGRARTPAMPGVGSTGWAVLGSPHGAGS